MESESEREVAKTAKMDCVCPYCGMFLNSKYGLTLHVRRHENNLPHKCPVCSKGFAIPYDLKVHSKVHTNDKNVKCQFCPELFRHSYQRLKHMEALHKLPYDCQFCNKSFTKPRSLKHHIQRTHTIREKSFKCSFCIKEFSSAEFCFSHEKVHKYVPHKGQRQLSKQQIKRKEDIRTIERGECFVCLQRFSGSEVALQHLKTCHPMEAAATIIRGNRIGKSKHASLSEKKYKCSRCDYVGKRRIDLVRHLPKHMTDKKYICLICNKGYVCKFRLSCHQKLHRTTKEFECDICDKKFTTKLYMNNHKKNVHSDSKLLCDICGKAFTCNYVLKNHMNIHKNNICSNTLSEDSPQNLNFSSKLSNFRAYFECFACGDVFITQSELSFHSKHHLAILDNNQNTALEKLFDII